MCFKYHVHQIKWFEMDTWNKTHCYEMEFKSIDLNEKMLDLKWTVIQVLLRERSALQIDWFDIDMWNYSVCFGKTVMCSMVSLWVLMDVTHLHSSWVAFKALISVKSIRNPYAMIEVSCISNPLIWNIYAQSLCLFWNESYPFQQKCTPNLCIQKKEKHGMGTRCKLQCRCLTFIETHDETRWKTTSHDQ